MADKSMAAPDQVRVASAQYHLEFHPDWASYEAKIRHWVGEASGAGAELLVFPEYAALELASLEGRAVAGDEGGALAAVARHIDKADALHLELAQGHGVHIVAGSGPARSKAGGLVNRARLFAPSGAVGIFDKRLLTPWEREWKLEPGTGPMPVFETTLGRIGIAICYDCEFPLPVRAMVELGARLLLFPSCTEKITGSSRVRVGAMARALENQTVAVVSQLVGDAPWCPAADICTGTAGIFAPADIGISDRGVVAEGEQNKVCWVHGTADFAACERVRALGGTRNHLHWCEQSGAADLSAHAEIISLL